MRRGQGRLRAPTGHPRVHGLACLGVGTVNRHPRPRQRYQHVLEVRLKGYAAVALASGCGAERGHHHPTRQHGRRRGRSRRTPGPGRDRTRRRRRVEQGERPLPMTFSLRQCDPQLGPCKEPTQERRPRHGPPRRQPSSPPRGLGPPSRPSPASPGASPTLRPTSSPSAGRCAGGRHVHRRAVIHRPRAEDVDEAPRPDHPAGPAGQQAYDLAARADHRKRTVEDRRLRLVAHVAHASQEVNGPAMVTAERVEESLSREH